MGRAPQSREQRGGECPRRDGRFVTSSPNSEVNMIGRTAENRAAYYLDSDCFVDYHWAVTTVARLVEV